MESKGIFLAQKKSFARQYSRSTDQLLGQCVGNRRSHKSVRRIPERKKDLGRNMGNEYNEMACGGRDV